MKYFIIGFIIVFLIAAKIPTEKDVNFVENFYLDKANNQFIFEWIKISDVVEYFLTQSDKVVIEYKKKKTMVEISYKFYRNTKSMDAILKITYDLKTAEYKELMLSMGYNTNHRYFYNEEAVKIILMLLHSANYDDLDLCDDPNIPIGNTKLKK